MIGFIFGFIPGWRVFSTLIGLTLFVLLAVIVYENVFAGPDELTPSETRVIDGLMEEISVEVQEFADEHQLRSIEVNRLRGDTPSGQVTLQVRNRLDRALSDAGVRVVGTGFTTRLRDSVFREIGEIDEEEEREEIEAQLAKARDEIREQVEKASLIDFVLYGSVSTEKLGDDAEVTLDLHLQGAEEGMHRNIRAQLSTLDELPASTGDGIQIGGFAEFLWRLIVFLIVGFFLPVVTGPLAMYAFRMESNAVNFLMLSLITVAAGLVAWTLTGFGTGGWAIVAVLLALAASGFWNYRVLDEWERRA